ncbi:MAG TPA: VOC family protein [Pelagibacterium sp.]|uniref:VOC family protein n=1 Tax=Pelagibacterium sp. TaxID=1967288 RepID=UPI002C826248|nr:VOC family protein [Pelagibacterium sp.]HWJ86742.1 VOC family protein [Pelagibacterium sp.]
MSQRPNTNKPAKGLDGNHHITGITADVQANVDFWSRIMGLRFIKKTLNFETTFRYHTYYSDTDGTRGSVVTFLEFNDAPKAKPGKGNHAAAILRVRSHEALDYWMDRLTQEQIYSELMRLDPTQPRRLVFEDFEGHKVELMATDAKDKPLAFPAQDIPEAYRITGIEGIRSYASLDELAPYAEHMGFVRNDAMQRFELEGATKTARWYTAPAPEGPFQEIGAGLWHHLALDAEDDLSGWRDFAHSGPIPTTPVYDHHVFDSCYTQTPGGIIELCNDGPGFLVDQTPEELGERLALSKRVEPLRARLERELTPITNPRRPDGSLRSGPAANAGDKPKAAKEKISG